MSSESADVATRSCESAVDIIAAIAAEMMIPAAEALLEKADYSRAQKMLRELAEIAPRDERILRLAIRAFRPSGDQETLTRNGVRDIRDVGNLVPNLDIAFSPSDRPASSGSQI